MIYVIADGRGRLKVGRATDPAKRLMNLQTGDADAHQLVGLVRLASRAAEVFAESSFHRAFKSLRAKHGGREWYRDSPLIRCWLRALALGNNGLGPGVEEW